ncbi:MAG: ribosomal protein S18-alanine N-acetyltransferase [Oscillospiraceae bacterium]|nr:ribosomal protein S18-alanine N-acetyltransferase [Oscillospiraceae bacterium]
MMLRADKNTPEYIFNELENLEKSCISDGWSAESFKSEALKDNGIVLYIQEDDKKISAFITAYTALGEADITNVVVSPEYRRRGYAFSLISELEKIIPEDTENIFLEVRESNQNAINLYLKSGFEKISIRKRFYSNPIEDAVIMKKER